MSDTMWKFDIVVVSAKNESILPGVKKTEKRLQYKKKKLF